MFATTYQTMSKKQLHLWPDLWTNRLSKFSISKALIYLIVLTYLPTSIVCWSPSIPSSSELSSSLSSHSFSSSPLSTPLASQYLQIPDHQGFIGKLYYYRLPICSSLFQQIKHISIKEVDKESLPKWLMLRKEKDRWELIGFPQEQDKRIHFFQVEVTNKDETKAADVFTLDITDSPPSQSYLASSSSPSLSTSSSGSKRNCIIRVIPTFNTILDIWKIISYLIPSKLRQEVELSAKLYELTSNLDETDNPNILISQWAYPLFTISQLIEKDGSRKYQLTIDKQECEVNKERLGEDDFHWKLKKLGLEFHHIEIIKSSILPEEAFFDDSPVEKIHPSRAYSKSYVPVSINFDSRNNNINHERRHARRHLPEINPTPSFVPDFMTVATTQIYPNPDLNEIDLGQLSRIVPSFTSPSAFPASSGYPASGSPQPPHTPRVPDIGNLGGAETGNRYTDHFHPILYTTPTITSEPPTDFIEGLSTPTPSLTSRLPDVSVTDTTDLVQPSAPISPSPTFGLIEPTASIGEEVTSEAKSSEKPDLIRPDLTTNARPELRNRIPKLAPTAGKYWTFKIPENTFIDREDGSTDKLKLGFYRVSPYKEREHPAKDYWIQFDSENQVLTAFPTDDDVGIYENQFYLEAVDSGGLSNVENITIHVRQHTSYRKFPYNITFYRVYWDPLRITTTVEALRNFAQTVSLINGDSNIDSFIVQHLKKEIIEGKDYWTIVSTNDSIPAYPCPKKKIQQLYNKLADKQSKGQYAVPSELLNSKMNKMFDIDGVGLSISCSKPNTAAEKPELRNPIDILRFRLGEVFRYKIPENMFYSGQGRNTYDLELSLYDGYGRVPPADGFVKFNEKTFEIVGLAVERKYIRENEFNLVARDRESENDASDALVIVIEDPWNEEEVGFQVTIGLSMNENMDLDYRLDIANRIATSILNDSDASALRILKIIKRNYTLMQSPGPYVGPDTKQPLPEEDDEENVVDRRRRRRRRKRSDPFDNSINEGSIYQMYEYVWTNKTETLLVKGGKCPSPAIQAQIIEKLYGRGASFETWDSRFSDKYRLVSIEFKAVGKCSGYLTNRDLYRDNIKPHIIHDKDIEHERDNSNNYGQPSSKDDDVHANELDDYYLRTIIPAIGTVALLLVVLCIIVCILVKCRRDIEKDRFDMTSRPGGDGYPSEVDAFIQKGRQPVILQSEYQQNLPLNTMMMTYGQSRQQPYPMGSANKSSYHALTHAVEQRRQPPPYR